MRWFCFQVILLSHSIQCSWSEIKMSFPFWSCVFASGTLLDRRCLAFICDIASLQESDIFPFNSVVTVWLDHCWCLVQDCALTVVWVCDDGSFSFLFFSSLVFAHLSVGFCFYSPIGNSTFSLILAFSSPLKVAGSSLPFISLKGYHLNFFGQTLYAWDYFLNRYSLARAYGMTTQILFGKVLLNSHSCSYFVKSLFPFRKARLL